MASPKGLLGTLGPKGFGVKKAAPGKKEMPPALMAAAKRRIGAPVPPMPPMQTK